MIALLTLALLSGESNWTWYYVGDGPPAVGECLQALGYPGDPQWADARILAPRNKIAWCQKWDAVLDPHDTPPPANLDEEGD